MRFYNNNMKIHFIVNDNEEVKLVLEETIDELCNDLSELHLHSKKDDVIDKINQYIESVINDEIIILRNSEVIQWLFEDTSFLPEILSKNKTEDTKRNKTLEDEWGKKILKLRRPDLKLDGQWTTRFGEHICEEVAILKGKRPTKPVKKEHFQPDIDIGDYLWEVKTQTYFTTGTAGEKILGCPFKYADLPILYDKPLQIICLGGAEKVCRNSYGNLEGPATTKQKQEFINFFRKCNIEFIAITDILRSIL